MFQQLHSRFAGLRRGHRRSITNRSLIGILISSPLFVAGYFLLGHVGATTALFVPLGTIMTGSCIVLALQYPRRRMLRKLERTGGVACLNCFHDLRGLDDQGHCPECGRPCRIADNLELLRRIRDEIDSIEYLRSRTSARTRDTTADHGTSPPDRSKA